MERLTFKQYLESKEQLRKAIANVPTSILEYEIRKYCTISLGETEEEKITLSLKPKQKIIVEWRYDDIHDPSPETIKFVGVKDVDLDETYETFWSGNKLTKWLLRHATRGENNGHKI